MSRFKRITAIIICLCFTVLLSACDVGKKGESDINPYKDYNLDDLVILPDYYTFDVKKISVTVTEEDVLNEIEIRRKDSGIESIVTEGTVNKGDTVYINYKGTKRDGTTSERLNYNGYQIEIGNSNFIDGFDEHLYNATIGEPIVFYLTFPEEYEFDETLSGETVTMEVTVTGKVVNGVQLLDSSFFIEQSSGEAETLDDFKEYIRKYLEDVKLEEAIYLEETKLFERIMDETEIKEIIEAELEKDTDAVIKLYMELAEGNGIEWSEYLKTTREQTEEEFYYQVRESSKDIVRAKMVTYALAEREDISLSAKEYNDILLNMARSAGCDTLEDYYNITKMHIETYAEAYGVLYNAYLDAILDKLYFRLAK